MTSCPAEEELVLHVEGELDPARAEAVADHLVACESCRRLVGRSEAALRYALGGLADAERVAAPTRLATTTGPAAPPRVRGLRRVAAFAATAAVAATLLAVLTLRENDAPEPSAPAAGGPVTYVAPRPRTLADEVDALLARTERLAAPPEETFEVSIAALAAAEARIDLGMDTGAARLHDVVERFPGTPAAREARARIAELEGGR